MDSGGAPCSPQSDSCAVVHAVISDPIRFRTRTYTRERCDISSRRGFIHFWALRGFHWQGAGRHLCGLRQLRTLDRHLECAYPDLDLPIHRETGAFDGGDAAIAASSQATPGQVQERSPEAERRDDGAVPSKWGQPACKLFATSDSNPNWIGPVLAPAACPRPRADGLEALQVGVRGCDHEEAVHEVQLELVRNGLIQIPERQDRELRAGLALRRARRARCRNAVHQCPTASPQAEGPLEANPNHGNAGPGHDCVHRNDLPDRASAVLLDRERLPNWAKRIRIPHHHLKSR